MAKHLHKACSHSLEHCTYCDVVSCSKCEMEWIKPKESNVTPWQSYILPSDGTLQPPFTVYCRSHNH